MPNYDQLEMLWVQWTWLIMINKLKKVKENTIWIHLKATFSSSIVGSVR